MRSMSRYAMALLAIAALIASGMNASAQQSPADQQQRQQQGQSMQQPGAGATQGMLPQGITPRQEDARDAVAETFAEFTKSSFQKGDFQRVIDHLSESDRQRLAEGAGQENQELNQAVDQFKQAWQSKYNREFEFDRDQALSQQFLSVTSGEIQDPQQVSHWPVGITGQPTARTAQPTLDRGTLVAVALLKGVAGKQDYHISLVREGTEWKIDIPDTVTADTLKSNLARHIQQVTAQADQWPADPAQAQQVVLRELLASVYDIQGQKGQMGQQGQMGGQQDQPGQMGQQGQQGRQQGQQY